MLSSRQPSPTPYQADLLSALAGMGATSFCQKKKKKEEEEEEIKTENLLLPWAACSWLDLYHLYNSDIMLEQHREFQERSGMPAWDLVP